MKVTAAAIPDVKLIEPRVFVRSSGPTVSLAIEQEVAGRVRGRLELGRDSC